MNILFILAGFGSGILAASMGSIIAFTLCGMLAVAASLVTAYGADAGFLTHGFSTLTFGPFLGPYVAFASAVATAGYAGYRGHLESGTDIFTPLEKFKDPKVLLVGGLFGALGEVLLQFYAHLGLAPLTDGGALVVVTIGIIARILYGKGRILGKYTGSEPRRFFPNKKEAIYDSVIGGGIGLLTSSLALFLIQAGVDQTAMSYYPFIFFGISATMYYATAGGQPIPATHHITYPSAAAALVGIQAFGPVGLVLGIIFGICTSLFMDMVAKTFNSHVDTHIDPPAVTIATFFFILTFIKFLFI